MKVERLTNEQEIRELIEWHNEHSEYVVLDTETTGLDPFSDKLATCVITSRDVGGATVFSGDFYNLLSDIRTPIVLHNYKFDYHFLNHAGVDLRKSMFYDTMLMHHLYDENASHALDSIIQDWYGDNYKEEFWAKYKTFGEAPQEEADRYAGLDVIYTRRVFEDLKVKLQQKGIPHNLLAHVHLLAASLFDTEARGIRVDLDYTLNMGSTLSAEITLLEEKLRNGPVKEIDEIETDHWLKAIDKKIKPEARDRVKRPVFNFNSPNQLKELLYGKLNLPVQLSKDRKPTADDAALERLEDYHPFIPLLREFRGKQKVYTSFIEGTLEKMQDGRVYPSFNVNGTVTGRISSSGPNMQQLPRSGGVRGIYVPDPGHVFVSRDYSQLEITLAAHFSLDPNLLKVVNEGASLHTITAEALGIDRQQAKTLNFALQYGAGVNKVAKILNCSKMEAEVALKKYWDTYPKLKEFIDGCHKCVELGSPLISPFGRHRSFVIPTGSDHWEMERAKRQAFNSIIQGTGADLTNRAFYNTHFWLKNNSFGHGVMTIHDECLISPKIEYAEAADVVLGEFMKEVGREIKLRVPLNTESSGACERWLD